MAVSLGACNAASRNISYDSDNVKVMRRVVFVNGIMDKYLLSIEGLCSITKDNGDRQLEVTCKTGEGEFKKHYLGISDLFRGADGSFVVPLQGCLQTWDDIDMEMRTDD